MPSEPHQIERTARDLVWVLSPFGEPAPRIVVGAVRAGALGILDLGSDVAEALAALELVTSRTGGRFGVRVSARCPLGLGDLPDAVDTIIVDGSEGVPAWRGQGPEVHGDDNGDRSPAREAWRVVAEVRSRDEAEAALAAGADGLVAKGAESGGRVGHVGAYLLSQQVLELTSKPVWLMGGIGRHTAAAAVVGGATGVVVDSQTALLDESKLPRRVRNAIAAMDGSETKVVAGHRIYTRPDLWVADLDEHMSSDDLVSRLGAADLAVDALPAGQDATLAARFADEYGTVGRMVRGLRQEILAHGQAAHDAQPLARLQGITATTGTTYPVVQGPMTRVSDRPAFAHSVAEGGGLPFLALALLRGDQVRPLLEKTVANLGPLPWGVGVLGFVPKELRDEQLAVIHDVKPPFALIAGGRPGQAVELEEAGIKTFLHVPAPGLLERFLADGARRFVFEGSECGGHIGPRSSFALWESQVEVLHQWGRHGDLSELDVLFAGGIHDERSASMVAAMAGPLAQGGARVGVLMGTAYLFTEEVVATGAIGEEFQAQALACERTAVLESGPGHVTRCAETPFVDLFERTRSEMTANGVDAGTRWAELESLNLGRLRLASKGLKRDNGASGDDAGVLVEVDRDEQRTDGMFMLGDVATLRSDLGTVDGLHRSVSSGATGRLSEEMDRLQAELPELDVDGWDPPRPQPVDVAIVGMACVMPGAPDLDTFWRNIVDGVNSITEVPPERWDVDTYFDPDWDHATASSREGSASKWGGFIPEVPFDALAYGIPPSSLAAVEPSQLLALKVAADALADAGYANRPFDRDRTSVIFGAEGATDQSAAHGFRAMFPAYGGKLPPELAEWLPRITEDTFPGLLPNVIAGRVANRLDLGGKNMTVDAACASSLAAVDEACIELATGRSDTVLAGGVDCHNGIQDFLLFTSVHALSTTGQCRTFDASADGISLGEGVGCIVLKRLEDAERDGDRVYAVIKSVAASSDGRSLGLTAPRPLGQERALRRAYDQADVDPSSIGLLEAHGTGTVVGDRTELATLTDVFADAGMEAAACVVGSVKSNIGHTKCAAGLAGVIKAAKSVYHGVLPPTLHVEQPNEGWDADTSPFKFLDSARPWSDQQRSAGVSAFGFGGTNFHAVLTSHDGDVPSRGLDAWPAELLVFRGSETQVERALADLGDRLDDHPATSDLRLRDVAAAVSSRGGRQPVRLAIVADDLDDLRAKVAHARAGRRVPGVYQPDDVTEGLDGTVAFLFPGQGSQRPGMAGDLFATFGETRDLLAIGEPWAGTMLPAAAFGDDGLAVQQAALTDTRVAQPALGLADLATARVLARFGVNPDMAGGHSYGELVALCAAGVYDEQTLLQLSEARAEAILAAATKGNGDDPGGMIAVAAGRDQVEPLLDSEGPHAVVVANENHSDQVVLAGSSPALEAVAERLASAGLSAKRLPVACAFHSPMVAAAADDLATTLTKVDVRPPTISVFSNLTAQAYPADADEMRELLAGQVAHGVRFAEEVQAMYDAGARIFVEVGPGRVLTGCVERILADQPHVAVATDRPGDNGVRSMLHALARLAVAGVAVDLPELFEDRGVDAARWTDPAPTAGWRVSGHLVRNSAGEVLPGALRPADTVPSMAVEVVTHRANGGRPADVGGGDHSVAHGNGAVANGPSGNGGAVPDQVLAEYFRTAHQIIESGHALLRDYLGMAPGAAVTTPIAPVPVEARGPAHALPQRTEADNPAQPAPASAAAQPTSVAEVMGTPEELLASLTEIVAARTGYPVDVLDPDLDVEADLSIDSIKRLEILGELADQIGLGGGGGLEELEHLVEKLAARKTLRGIVDFLFEHAPAVDQATSTVNPPPPQESAVQAVSVAEAMGTPEELLVSLTGIVAARTGYPEDVLDPDLDVEADLSIDSIKRLEILGELADQIGLGGGGGLEELEHLVEKLAARKTLRGIVDFLFEHAPGAAQDTSAAGAAESAGIEPDADLAGPASTPDPGGAGSSPIPALANRFVVELTDVALPDDTTGGATTQAMRITGSGPLAAALEAELSARGIDARRATPSPGDVDGAGFVVLTDLFDGVSLPELYGRMRPLLTDTTCTVVVAAPLGGGLGIDPPPPSPTGSGGGSGDTDQDTLPVGAGVRGLVKTAALELPDRRVRLVDLDPSSGVDQLAKLLADECVQEDGPVEVAWREGRRRVPTLVAHVHPNGDSNGHVLPLTGDSVVLLTGGARGITARAAVALAQRAPCRLYLVGRSPWPVEDEDPALAACPDRMSLRAALTAGGERDLKAVEARCDRILAAREMRQLETELDSAGATFSYHPLDVRDATAFEGLITSIYETHGRLDGIVHGAGVLDDHFIADKSQADFERVFETKVDSARSIVRAVRRGTADLGCPAPAFLAFFASIAGVCGNRGQADYAAANDALDMIAAANPDVASRVFSIDWGPWSSDVGMVSDSLARVFEASGMGLIEPDDGTTVLLDEIAVAANGAAVPGRSPQARVTQVVAARCRPELLGGLGFT